MSHSLLQQNVTFLFHLLSKSGIKLAVGVILGAVMTTMFFGHQVSSSEKRLEAMIHTWNEMEQNFRPLEREIANAKTKVKTLDRTVSRLTEDLTHMEKRILSSEESLFHLERRLISSLKPLVSGCAIKIGTPIDVRTEPLGLESVSSSSGQWVCSNFTRITSVNDRVYPYRPVQWEVRPICIKCE